MPEARIFISYRRDDAAGYARAIYAELARQFGDQRVFMDVDDIGAGQAFDEVIQRAVDGCEVLLVMIGKRWHGEREGRPPRLFDAADFVRQEVAAGLAGGKHVIPLLLDGAAMPGETQLPETLRPLARRNAIEIGNARFAADMQRLVVALREALREPAAPPLPVERKPPRRWLLAAPVVAIALVALWQLRTVPRGDGAASPVAASASATAPNAASAAAPNAARAGVNGEWQADVNYDWPNARYVERFVFGGEAGDLHGSASFLRVPRGILEGRAEAGGLSFVTRSTELAGGAAGETVHRYRGQLAGSEIRFVMQTEGSGSAHLPVEFVARRVAAASASGAR